MKIYTWRRLFDEEFKKHPEQLKAFGKLPTNYISFEHWLSVDVRKCDIVAKVISCKCAQDLRLQQQEAMKYRQGICGTPKEWLERFSSDAAMVAPIDCITERFAKQRRCHRNYQGKKAGVRCYCDEHKY